MCSVYPSCTSTLTLFCSFSLTPPFFRLTKNGMYRLSKQSFCWRSLDHHNTSGWPNYIHDLLLFLYEFSYPVWQIFFSPSSKPSHYSNGAWIVWTGKDTLNASLLQELISYVRYELWHIIGKPEEGEDCLVLGVASMLNSSGCPEGCPYLGFSHVLTAESGSPMRKAPHSNFPSS